MDYSKRQEIESKTPLEYRNGPIQNEYRSMTDVFWCILLAVVMLGVIAVGGYAFYQGDPKRIV
jgi:hypothetical protein